MHGRGGPNTAAADGPGGPIVAGDHRRRDSPTSPSSGTYGDLVGELTEKPSPTLGDLTFPYTVVCTIVYGIGQALFKSPYISLYKREYILGI